LPDPLDRHARPGKHASYGEEPKLSRSQLRRIAAETDGGTDPAKKAPGKKDPAMCKGTHWKEPHPAVLRIRTFPWQKNPATCGWWITYKAGQMVTVYHCLHRETCGLCEKILRNRLPPEQCPGFHAITTAEQAAIDAEITRREEAAATRAVKYPRLRKPVITGPQGYRKRKGT
jgi:hypothetical protein